MIVRTMMRSLIALALLIPAVAAAQTPGTPPPAASDQLLKPEQLEALVSPIALYPDSLLSNVLMASTYPLEIVQAERWLTRNKKLSGDALKAAADKQAWDDSVKALIATPPVLAMMISELDWAQKLGDAVLAQQSDVMDAIQRLRLKAQDNGKLATTPEQKVTVEQQDNRRTVVIEQTNDDTVYVPAYDPAVAYGAWPYAEYPPYYWGYPDYWGYGIATGVLARGLWFGAGYALGRWTSGNGAGAVASIGAMGTSSGTGPGRRLTTTSTSTTSATGAVTPGSTIPRIAKASDTATGTSSSASAMPTAGPARSAVAAASQLAAGLGAGAAIRGAQRHGAANRQSQRHGAANRPAHRRTAANRPAHRTTANRAAHHARAGGLHHARGRASFGGGARGGMRAGGGGGFRGGGGRGGGRRSDVALKHDIVLLGHLDNGLGFYRFAYNGSNKAYVGVMAQEVQNVLPRAVVRGRDGYLRVFYDQIDVKFETYDQWVRSGKHLPAGPPVH